MGGSGMAKGVHVREVGEALRAGVRRGLMLSPARASLAAFSAAMVVASFALYVALLPGLASRFAPQPTYNETSLSSEASAADIVRSLMGGAHGQQSEDAPESGDGESAASLRSSSGILGSTVLVATETVQRAAAEESSKGSASQDAADGASSPNGTSGDTGSSAEQPSGGSAESPSFGVSNGSAGSVSGLTPSQESSFRNTLVQCFNALTQVSGSVRESYGYLSTCASTGDFSNAASWYSATSSYDSTIDSVKATLNRQVATAEQSQYYQAWNEIQLMTNDLGRASAETLGCWGQAVATGSAPAAASAPGYYDSYRTHESNARDLL